MDLPEHLWSRVGTIRNEVDEIRRARETTGRMPTHGFMYAPETYLVVFNGLSPEEAVFRVFTEQEAARRRAARIEQARLDGEEIARRMADGTIDGVRFPMEAWLVNGGVTPEQAVTMVEASEARGAR